MANSIVNDGDNVIYNAVGFHEFHGEIRGIDGMTSNDGNFNNVNVGVRIKMVSPNGTQFLIKIDNDGNLIIQAD